jgi:DNA-binding transcriptional MerR regulator
MSYTVKQLAKIAGISVRTLHYYDEIGLLEPSFVKENGYRQYEEAELLKLQQILFFRELEFPLEEIVKIMSSSNFDAVKALRDQRKLLEMKKERINGLLVTIDKTIANLKGGESMSNDDLFGSFTDDDISKYKDEVKEKWGNTDAYKQSMERTKHWTKEDYKKAAADSKLFLKKLGDTMDKGATSPEFQALVEEQYKSVNRFYDCSLEMFKNLGEMYIADPRFTKTYEDVRPGLAKFVKEAMDYYVEAQQKLRK